MKRALTHIASAILGICLGLAASVGALVAPVAECEPCPPAVVCPVVEAAPVAPPVEVVPPVEESE